ncbi:MAG: hypothetical protein M1818_004820 [Claussenomyces sp. TS43310]|nr:MAG: hypothetical protein M1818_004820 [Claussenomyces sp. TS43310]
MSTLPPRPSPTHKLAISFPETEVKPLLIWVPCHRKASSEYEEYGVTAEYETANLVPLLGKDDPFPGSIHIEYNTKRDKCLGSGMAVWSPKKEGYSIKLMFREAFSKDGSRINRSIMESVKTSGTVHHKWCGPIVAMRHTYEEFYEDITLADFRHLIDYLVTYATSEVREINPETYVRTPRAIRGVKICCYGEIKLHGSEPYVPVEVPKVHPIYQRYIREDVSPISKLLGRSIRLWKFPDIEAWIDPPGWNENLCADSNPNAAFLMIGADPKSTGWGWAPLYWNNEIGNVLVVRDDGGDLSVDELRLMCHFVRRKLQPMFEDSMGAGLVARTKHEVLRFITRENMEKCKGELQGDRQGAFSF